MQAVEKKYQEDPAKYGGEPNQSRMNGLPRGAVVVTVNRGGAGFICAQDLCVRKVSPGGQSATAGLKVGMKLTDYSAGGSRRALEGISWATFKDVCRQSPYPRVFTFCPASDRAAGQGSSSTSIPEGVADRPRLKASSAAKDKRKDRSDAARSKAEAEAAAKAKAEQDRMEHRAAASRAEVKRKEEEEKVRAKAEEQVAAAAAKAAEETAAAVAAKVAKAAEERAAKVSAEVARAAQAAKEAEEEREAEAAEEERRAREARLKPSGPVNVYISPLM